MRTNRRFVLTVPAALALLLAPASNAWAGGSETDAIARAKEIEAQVVELVEKISPAYVVIGGGSGIVISSDGWMLTNHHVAGSKSPGDFWRVKLPGGKIYKAKMVGTDPRGDISVLKIESDKPLPFCPLGDSDALVVGDVAICLGNPFGFAKDATPTVTLGVVSAVHRFQGGYSDAIQVDAPINPGNSGGPCLNLKGEVVGINGRVAVRFGNRVNTGVGYAIPANQIKNFMAAFRAGGVVKHGTLQGVSLGNGKTGIDGAIVTRVRRNTNAAKAGLEKGDIIVQVEGYPIPNLSRLRGVLGTFPAGTDLNVKVKRGDSTKELVLALGARRTENVAFLGVTMSQQATEDGKGVEIEEVSKGSAAEKAGLLSGDVIIKIDGTDVNSSEELGEEIRGHKPGDEIKLTVKRGAQTLTLTAKLGKRSG